MKNTFKILLLIIIFSCNSVMAQNEELIFTSFHQGPKDNCASVALLKAAVYKYGLGKVISYKHISNGIHVLLKSKQEFNLSNSEISIAKKASGFIKTNNRFSSKTIENHIIEYADTLYAVEAKYISIYGYSGCDKDPLDRKYNTFKLAIDLISNNGVCTDNVYKYLGLSIKGDINDYDKNVNFKLLKGTILYSATSNHAIAVFENSGDDYGELVLIKTRMKVNNNNFKPEYFLSLE